MDDVDLHCQPCNQSIRPKSYVEQKTPNKVNEIEEDVVEDVEVDEIVGEEELEAITPPKIKCETKTIPGRG